MNDASPFILPGISQLSVETLTALILNGEEGKAALQVEHLLAGGVAAETVMTELLAPSARLMGEMWCEDQRDFVEVTLGLARLQHLLRRIRLAPGDGIQVRGQALLIPVPGEQHTFGVRLVEEHLLLAGWKVVTSLNPNQDEIGHLVSTDYYDFVGISLTSGRLLPGLRSAIRNVRTYSRNRTVRIIVGGVLFAGRASGPAGIDADAIVDDAQQAVMQAERWYGTAEVD